MAFYTVDPVDEYGEKAPNGLAFLTLTLK